MGKAGTRIGLVTSGGDAPGMNACVRAVVKGAPDGVTVVGVRNGGLGLLRNALSESTDGSDYFELAPADVASILHRSGTILKSARESKFRDFVLQQRQLDAADAQQDMTRDDHYGRLIGELAAAAMESNGLDGLILIGGDTTCRAATHVYAAIGDGFPIVVVPATIDNDIAGTVQTIGFDSAVSMAVLQVDAIRETAAAMDRIFVVEVMGRDQGHLAAEVGLATGAEVVLVPECVDYSPAVLNDLAESLTRRVQISGSSALVIVAEGARLSPLTASPETPPSPAQIFAGYLDAQPDGAEVRVTILGHTLRGAPPTAFTRNLATRSGLRAVTTVEKRARDSRRQRPPMLLGMHHEGFLEEHELRGDMVRRDRNRVLAIVGQEIGKLAY